MHDVGWGWWLMSSIGMVAFWGLVIYGVFLLMRNAGGPAPTAAKEEPPDEVLKRRLAAGEIDVEEYDRVRRALSDEERAPTPG